MFISSCYFIYNAWRDKAAEREFDIVDDTGTRSSSEIQEKKWAKKSNFKQIYVNQRVFKTQSSISDEIYFRK